MNRTSSRTFVRLLTTQLLAAAVTLAFASGCSSSAPPPAAPGADAPAPYPYSVYDIRAGCPLGRTIEYRVEKAGSAPTKERWAFKPLAPESVSVTTTRFDAEGKPLGEPTTESATWAELHEHARFPQSATKIYNESLTVPAGTFDVMRYVVTKGSSVNTFWFARSLPGPPVKLEMVKDGQAVMTMTMEANRTH